MVAPFTAATENVSKVPLHTDVRPVIVPGVAGGEVTTTVNIWAAELPQTLLAVTETVPLVPALPVIALMVDPVVVQPFGSVHV